jgi:hypothetical protein
MTKHHPNHHSAAFLVDIAGTHALVDAAGERLFVLNTAGADAWRSLNAGTPPRTLAEAVFARELADRALLPAPAATPVGDPAPAPSSAVPRILSEAPLQVAAGTSDPNPFSADASW